jgi:hypothetical protein
MGEGGGTGEGGGGFLERSVRKGRSIPNCIPGEGEGGDFCSVLLCTLARDKEKNSVNISLVFLWPQVIERKVRI